MTQISFFEAQKNDGWLQVIVGSFIWGGSKTKNKKKEASEGAIDSEHQTVDNPDALTSIPPTQNLSPISSVGVWPASRAMDMRNAHVDIDLMRGWQFLLIDAWALYINFTFVATWI